MPSRVWSTSFIGRRSELARLEEALEQARHGHPSILLLGGDAGIGKTRLLDEFAGRARDSGALVLTGACLEVGEGTLPHAPLVGALRGLARQLGDDRLRALLGSHRRDLGHLVPALVGSAPESAGPDPGSPARLFEAVLGVLGRLSAEGPAVLAIEDLHWADRSTLDLVTFLAHELERAEVVVIGTYRTDELHRRHVLRPFLAELGRLPIVERIELAPFDREELLGQLTGILGRPPDPRLADDILERSEGNAFYAEELLAAVDAGAAGVLPPTLRDILAVRLAVLSDVAQQVVRIAAAAGRTIDHRLLEQVVELDGDQLREGLREALSHGVLVTDPDGQGYAFRHALLQEAAHDELLPGERTRLHRAVAEAFERDPSLALGVSAAEGADAELAHHWQQAHDLDRAFAAALRGAPAATRVFAYPEALRLQEQALELWERVDPETLEGAGPRWQALLDASYYAIAAGDPRRGAAHAGAALDAARDAEADDATVARVLQHLSRSLWLGTRGTDALDRADEAVATVPAAPSAERAEVLAWYGRLLMLNGRYGDAVPVSREAVDIAQQVGARAQEGVARNSLGTCLAPLPGHEDEGIAHLRAALEIAHESEDIDNITRGYANLGSVLANLGRPEDARALTEEGLDWLRERGVGGASVDFIELNLITTLTELGETEEAQRRFTRLRPTGADTTTLSYHMAGASLGVARGADGAVRQHVDEGLALAEQMVDPQYLGPLRSSAAALAVREGRYGDALSHLASVPALIAEPAHPLFGRWLEETSHPVVDAALDAARRGNDADIPPLRSLRDRLAEARSLVDRAPDAPALTVLRSAVLRGEAELTRLDGPDPDAWRRYRSAAEEIGWRPRTAYASLRLAEAILDTAGDREDAAVELQRAYDTARAVGAEPLREQVVSLARRARIDLEGVEADASENVLGLTPREREVLELVAEGRTNREIGEALYISEKTASVHVSNILAKLEVSNRGEAAAVAHRRGFVRTP